MADISTLRLPDSCEVIALCGGPYSNFAAVEAFLTETAAISQRFCLGDIGGFGPHPNRTLELIRQAQLICLQGNYDEAVGHGLRDCGCGYSDERDRQFAQISYDYTYANTAPEHRAWLRTLPPQLILQWRDRRILLCHGSPDQVNQFVWDSESDDTQLRDYLQRFAVDGICATHSGLPWIRTLAPTPSQRGGFWFNVGVLGRPANRGLRQVHYGLLHFGPDAAQPSPQLMNLSYNVAAVTAAMAAEGLPAEFAESLETGLWTTCAEILPPAERGALALAAAAAES